MAMGAGMVIIGAGECGARAAVALREQGYDGSVTLVGAERHLPYERPPLSKEAMAADDPQAKTIADHARLAAHGIDFMPETAATGIDRHARRVLLGNGTGLAYERLLIATGATPRRLPFAHGPRMAYLRTFDDALAIRRHLGPGRSIAIIGGGFIGLELAAAARRVGAEVTLIEAQPRILMRGVPQEIAAVIDARHRAEGVELVTGDGIADMTEGGACVTLRLASGRRVEADLAIIGIGAAPATDLARSAGLAIENGIAVDEYLRTSDPDIFAAGDCCSFPLALYGGRRMRLEAWRNAQEQGTLAARNMLGHAAPHSAVPWFWSDQYDLGLQIAGLCDEGGHVVRRDLGEDAFILFHLADDGRLVAASGIGQGTAVARDIRLAEMLIARGAKPDARHLASPATRLKTLLAA
ncbi:FAD-dependent oxidoreductase [Mesorhizobium sp. RMAD-H1]|uniref:NAD(P)/FAD-dependent oxidoreductase n=1 Tax=Mesorhizobium sp. RMAD-H1 TaxID=2587065 RepID=UPI00160FA51D|nr:FAD-dependent oxidoreductase [Mesorhizobium sp. RMAD-H1]MBB2971915.1 3-phenylpropionate/trans-cinnamate dioxygenase ferredoxin reductase subunit [Mesorhizobium sp. RMAD-H1]